MDEQPNNIVVNKEKKSAWKIAAFSFIALFAISLFFSFFEVNIAPRQSKRLGSRPDKPGNVLKKLALGESLSSASDYSWVLSEIEPVKSGGGGGCGV